MVAITNNLPSFEFQPQSNIEQLLYNIYIYIYLNKATKISESDILTDENGVYILTEAGGYITVTEQIEVDYNATSRIELLLLDILTKQIWR